MAPMSDLRVVLTETVTIGNTTYSPGSYVPLGAALEAGAITWADAQEALKAHRPTPRNASAPGRVTRPGKNVKR